MGVRRALLLAGVVCALGGHAGPRADPLDVLAPLGPGQGRVFAPVRGAVVRGWPLGGGRPIWLADGEPVGFLRWREGRDGADAVAVVIARGQELAVPNERVVTESRLYRSPDGQFAVMVATQSCPDRCRATGWLLAPEHRVRFAGVMDADASVAWRADGRQVAVGSNVVFVMALPGGALSISTGFTNPRYDAEGRLLLTRRREPRAVYEWVSEGPPRQIRAGDGPPAEPARPPPAAEPARPAPVAEAAPPAAAEASPAPAEASAPAEPAPLLRPPPRPPVARDQIRAGGRPPRAVVRAVAAILDPDTPPSRAVRVARRQRRAHPGFAHLLARAANTRGYRLFRAGYLSGALPLFATAAALDRRYALPRASAARICAVKGDARGCARWLREVKRLGPAAQRRMARLRVDPAINKVIDNPEVRALLRRRRR